MEREVRRLVLEEESRIFHVLATPQVIMEFIGPFGEYIDELEQELDCELYARAEKAMNPEHYEILPQDSRRGLRRVTRRQRSCRISSASNRRAFPAGARFKTKKGKPLDALASGRPTSRKADACTFRANCLSRHRAADTLARRLRAAARPAPEPLLPAT